MSLALPASAAIVTNPAAGYPFTTVALDQNAVDPSLTYSPFEVDFNGDALIDFSAFGVIPNGTPPDDAVGLVTGIPIIKGASPSSTAYISVVPLPGGGPPVTRLFAYGESIGAGPSNYASFASYQWNGKEAPFADPPDDTIPLLTNGLRRYTGVQFPIGSDFHFAWVDIEGAGGGNFTIHGWGWETTPNTPILAGAVGVPTADPSGGGAGTAGSVAAARAAVNAQIGQYRAMQANQAHARRVAEAKRLQAARR